MVGSQRTSGTHQIPSLIPAQFKPSIEMGSPAGRRKFSFFQVPEASLASPAPWLSNPDRRRVWPPFILGLFLNASPPHVTRALADTTLFYATGLSVISYHFGFPDSSLGSSISILRVLFFRRRQAHQVLCSPLTTLGSSILPIPWLFLECRDTKSECLGILPGDQPTSFNCLGN